MFDVFVHPAQLSDVAQVFNWEHLNFDSAVSEKTSSTTARQKQLGTWLAERTCLFCYFFFCAFHVPSCNTF
jgi:hypothetical protein